MNLFDAMILDYKILVLYALKNISIIELRKIIWEKIFDYEELELATQTWYEIELHEIYTDSE